METIELLITPVKKLWFDEESYSGGYGCTVHPDYEDLVKTNRFGSITIKGLMPQLEMREEYRVVVTDASTDKFKSTYAVVKISQDRPITPQQQRKFLKSILTDTQATNIFNHYNNGEDLIGMIEDGTFDYKAIKGLGETTYAKMREKVFMNLELAELLIFLEKYKIKFNQISKVLKEYQNPKIVIEKIETNPYLLTQAKGVGFVTADAIAKAIGFSPTSPHRITACIHHVIEEENQNGHSWINKKQLFNRCIDYLNIERSLIEEVLNGHPEGITILDDRYTKTTIYKAEDYVALRLNAFVAQSKKLFTDEEVDTFIENYCKKNNVELEAKQREFFDTFNTYNASLLIGSGGMGKSWLIKILLELLDTKSLKVALLSPTGKASKVLSNYTGREASTIHRKIKVFDSEQQGQGEIWEDVIVVDEVSMCDVLIMEQLMKAIKHHGSKVLFIGDDFQLPSVGVGNVLYDCIKSGVIPITKLRKVFRQSKGGILNVATDIREGNEFLRDHEEGRKVFGNDCVFWLVDSEFICDGVVDNYKKALKKFKMEDIAVITPRNVGSYGTMALNKLLQELVNPASDSKQEKTFGKKNPVTFRQGDLVMNLVNTYNVKTIEGEVVDIFNGDTGIIQSINEEDKEMIIDYEGLVVRTKFDGILSTLVHAWAITTYKAQGSQYKAVIMVADSSMAFQLNANLLYTSASRAKAIQCVLTQAKTINNAMMKFANMQRRSFLQELLEAYAHPEIKIETKETIETKEPVAVGAGEIEYESYD